jgi:hypothetical protein
MAQRGGRARRATRRLAGLPADDLPEPSAVQASWLCNNYTLSGDLLEKLFRKRTLHDSQECLYQSPHVIEIALLNTAPNAGPIADDD